MQALNEAYNTLRHPERRRRYDQMLAAQRGTFGVNDSAGASAGGPTNSAPRSSSTASRPHPASAWLSYQKRIGDEIVFAIGHADNMTELLVELQRRIPPADRRYEISQNRWHVHVAHADVLRSLFRNYAPVVQQSTATTPRSVAPRRRPVPPSPAPVHKERRRAWMGVGMAVAFALAIYLLVLGQLLVSDSPVATAEMAVTATPGRDAALNVAPPESDKRALVFPDDCASTQLETAPAYFRAACKTLEHDPQVTTPAPTRPYAVIETRVASNIRSGPDTRFPVLTTAPPGARVQLVGYTISRGYVWFLTNFGGWIRSDLLTESPLFLPMVGAEEMS